MPELPEVETIRRGLVKKILHQRIVGVEVKKPKLIQTTTGVSKDLTPGVEKRNVEKFKKILTGASFSDIKRRGKLLIFSLASHRCILAPGVSEDLTPGAKETYLLAHLKMTGQLVYQNRKQITAGGHPFPPVGQLPNKFSHIIFTFTDQSRLFYNDQRQFGYMRIVDQKELDNLLNNYGIDPLSKKFTWENFRYLFWSRSDPGSRKDPIQDRKRSTIAEIRRLAGDPRLSAYRRGRREKPIRDRREINTRCSPQAQHNTGCYFRKTPLKTFLMNQSLIAGIGNIYADEICFAAGIKPHKKINMLTLPKKQRIFDTINQILAKAIDKGGTTFSDYRDAVGKKGNYSQYLMVYHRTGEKCKRCHTGRIKKITLNQRGTHFCPQCQQ